MNQDTMLRRPHFTWRPWRTTEAGHHQVCIEVPPDVKSFWKGGFPLISVKWLNY